MIKYMGAPRPKIVHWEDTSTGFRVSLECGHIGYVEFKGKYRKGPPKRTSCYQCWKDKNYDEWLKETMKDSK